ncbi:MAG: response regulator [bacterium]|nr:response regulator [bacterium]MDY4099118.1 response regulator [Lachnospiraceae bacterium]
MFEENNKITALLEKVFDRMSAVYALDLQEQSYEKIKADVFMDQILGAQGDLKDAYAKLFLAIREGDRVSNAYEAFRDQGIFEKENYAGNIRLIIGEKEQRYDYRILKMGDASAVIIFFLCKDGYESDRMEKLKMDTIQENYLFSMIGDLKNDTLRNSVTTELSVDKQDYLELKYSDWRYMISNMFQPDDRVLFLQISDPKYVMEQLEKQKSYRFEVQMQNMQGQYIWVRLMFHRMQGFSKENPVFIYTVQDIDAEMKRLLQQENIIAAVEEQNQKLKDINQAKSVFISNMSHEIRTPINAVLGMDEMILRETKDEQIRSYAYDIKNAGRMLLSIINDILDYSKIEAGKMEILPDDMMLGNMLDDINRLIDIKAKEKDLDFIVEISPELPSKVYGDELRIKQVIINILTNAVKYTPKGSVTFAVNGMQTTDHKLALHVEVADTGIGMKQEDMNGLFSAFQRLDEKRNRNIEGTGLGMSIVVRLLEQMGTNLEVESVYGEGSVFSFTLELPVMDESPIGDIQTLHDRRMKEELSVRKPYAKGSRILVVDDNQINLAVLEGLMKDYEVELDCAISGKRALKMIGAKHYDLILLDHLMPEMDGIETLGHIRDMGGSYAKLPVIALTANVSGDSRRRYMQAGFSDFLEKPISVPELERVLEEFLPGEDQ